RGDIVQELVASASVPRPRGCHFPPLSKISRMAAFLVTRITHILALALCLAPATCFAATPFLEKLDLFTAGDGGYQLYHIPGVVVTAKGTVLAWCEARKKGSDWDDIHILLRRSTDDGKTWTEPRDIAQVPGPKEKNPFALRLKNVVSNDVTYNNPVLIADRD